MKVHAIFYKWFLSVIYDGLNQSQMLVVKNHIVSTMVLE